MYITSTNHDGRIIGLFFKKSYLPMIIMINPWIKDQSLTQNKSLYKENEAFFM